MDDGSIRIREAPIVTHVTQTPQWTPPQAPKPKHRLRWILAGVVGFFVLIVIISVAAGGAKNKPAVSSPKAPAPAAKAAAPKTHVATSAPKVHVAAPAPAPKAAPAPAPKPAPATPPPVPARQVTGTATTLGAGSFTGGTDVAPGLYDVTTAPGQSGNFIVNGTDEYNEILGANGIDGVAKVRVQISSGDSIQISDLSQVVFTPVTTPLLTTHSTVSLYAGTWTVGKDLGPGRYVATPGAGQSGNFIVDNEDVNEILGGSDGVPNVTMNLQTGDVVTISGLGQVTMSAA
jgi:hypothetical protein